MKAKLATFVVMLIFWVVLSGMFDAFHLTLGVISCLLVAHFSHDLLFYGCDVAATSDGQELIESMAALTGVDVAASDDLTGHADLGGDWLLEYSTGIIETRLIVSGTLQAEWQAVLVTTANDDAYSTDENTVINQAAPGVLANDSGSGFVPTPVAGARPPGPGWATSPRSCRSTTTWSCWSSSTTRRHFAE